MAQTVEAWIEDFIAAQAQAVEIFDLIEMRDFIGAELNPDVLRFPSAISRDGRSFDPRVSLRGGIFGDPDNLSLLRRQMWNESRGGSSVEPGVWIQEKIKQGVCARELYFSLLIESIPSIPNDSHRRSEVEFLGRITLAMKAVLSGETQNFAVKAANALQMFNDAPKVSSLPGRGFP